MSEPGLTSEQRAAIAVHNATHARQCLASVSEHGWGKDGTLCQRCAEVADQIDAAVLVAQQAAEERGRRAGIEEAAKRVDQWYLHESHESFSPGGAIRSLLTQKLAPRDSASATSDYPGCGDPAHDCRDGVCGAGPVPRKARK